MYSLPVAFVASFSLSNIRDKDTFSSCPARIEAFFVTFPASTFNPVKTADKFSAVFSASFKSLV